MHKNVEAAEPADNLINTITARCRIGYVRLHKVEGRTVSPDAGYKAVRRLGGSRNSNDQCPLLCEEESSGGADAAGASGNQADPSA
jgi:hypothetical protein